MISTKLKELRKQTKMSQEKLAEKLNVSRQAVTKWETGLGTPDIENLKAISNLFKISLDELIGNQIEKTEKQEFLFNSITEYDIDNRKDYDITFAGAKKITVSACNSEKLKVKLYSNSISEIESVFKVKIDDNKHNIDIDIKRFGDITETKAKEYLYIEILIPSQYIRNLELAGNTEILQIKDIKTDNFEFSGKTLTSVIENVVGHIEVNSNEDMDIVCKSINGRLDINQISATSKLHISDNIKFATITRGLANRIIFEKDGNTVDDFSAKDEERENCESIIELNGMKSELIISRI